jgi:quinoprotein glucose dehydrogenase
LKVALDETATELGRLHAIWGLDQIARGDNSAAKVVLPAIRTLTTSSSAILRAAAVKIAGERNDQEAIGVIREGLTDSEPRVRYFAMCSLAKLRDVESFSSVVHQLAENNNLDPALRHAGIMYLSHAGTNAQVAELKSAASESVRLAAVVALRRRNSDLITEFLGDESDRVVSEAARGIYDQPMIVPLTALAGIITRESSDIELIRRILAANYRLGTSVEAIAVGRFAADVTRPEALRLEALDMLSKWAEPDPRDWILNAYRPISPRSETIAERALSLEIDSLMVSTEKLRERAMTVAAGLGIKKIAPVLAERVTKPNERPAGRAAALLALARLEPQVALQLAQQVELDSPTPIVLAALRVFADFDPDKSIPRFVSATESGSVQVRQLAWDLLGKIDTPQSTNHIVSGVKRYLEGKLPDDVQLNVLEAATNRLPDGLKKNLSSYQETLADADPLATWAISIHGGDSAKGERLFFDKTELSCVRCHQVDRLGGNVGPNLTSIGKTRDRRYLLEAIVNPDAKIAEGFETTVIANDEGQVLTGIVKSDDGATIQLLQNDGSILRIPIESIVARKKGKSSMPADLVKHLSPRELRDLVAYLASLQSEDATTPQVQ